MFGHVRGAKRRSCCFAKQTRKKTSIVAKNAQELFKPDSLIISLLLTEHQGVAWLTWLIFFLGELYDGTRRLSTTGFSASCYPETNIKSTWKIMLGRQTMCFWDTANFHGQNGKLACSSRVATILAVRKKEIFKIASAQRTRIFWHEKLDVRFFGIEQNLMGI